MRPITFERLNKMSRNFDSILIKVRTLKESIQYKDFSAQEFVDALKICSNIFLNANSFDKILLRYFHALTLNAKLFMLSFYYFCDALYEKVCINRLVTPLAIVVQ